MDASVSPGGGTRRDSLLLVQRQLQDWNHLNCPSESGYVVEDVPPGHPLHAAVAELEKHYGGALPKPAIRYWRRFLKLARAGDEAAEDEADALLEWIHPEIGRTISGDDAGAAPKDGTPPTLNDFIFALGQVNAARLHAARFSKEAAAMGPALKGSPAAYKAHLRYNEDQHAQTWSARLKAMPGHDLLQTLCIAREGEFSLHAFKRLAAKAALASGGTLEDLSGLPLTEAAKLLAGDSPPRAGSEAKAEGAAATPVKAGAGSKTGKRRDSLAKLEQETPPLGKGDGQWVRTSKAATLEGLDAATLRKYRSTGEANANKTFGRDRDGRIWRRQGTPKAHPLYLRKSLLSERTSKKA